MRKSRRGTFHDINICPDCKSKTRKKILRKKYAQRKYDTNIIINDKGHVIEEHYKAPKRECLFCKRDKRMTYGHQEVCYDCNKVKPNNTRAAKCDACGIMYWCTHKNTKAVNFWCSATCKEILRKHYECLTCDERILPKKPIYTKYCSTKCRKTMEKINIIREERDGKGNSYTPSQRYSKILSYENVKQSIVEEFKKDV